MTANDILYHYTHVNLMDWETDLGNKRKPVLKLRLLALLQAAWWWNIFFFKNRNISDIATSLPGKNKHKVALEIIAHRISGNCCNYTGPYSNKRWDWFQRT